jgi:O-methyltransferase involved in polyketide biosynthesis
VGGLLIQSGFEPDKRSCWLLEGFLFCLPGETLRRIRGRVSGLAGAGSRLGFDIINGDVLTSPNTRPWIEMQAAAGAPWIGTLDDPAGFLAGLGWRATLSQIGQPDANYDRWTGQVIPVTAPGLPHNWYVTARRA